MSGVKGRSGGHNKKTLAEKQILGVKKDRLNSKAPALIPARVVNFDGLGEIGKAIFNHYEPMLHNNGTLSASDAIVFHQLCKRYEDWFEMVKSCEEKGRHITTTDKHGNERITVAPWARLEGMYFDQLLKACREFGLTPVSRSTVEKIATGEPTNPLGGLTI